MLVSVCLDQRLLNPYLRPGLAEQLKERVEDHLDVSNASWSGGVEGMKR